MADRIVVLRDGVVQQVGTPGEVYGQPTNRFVATFVGSPPMNLLPGRLASHHGACWFDGAVTLELPAAPTGADGAVTLGIRPEALHLVGSDDRGAIEGTVDLVESVGADIYLSVSVGPETTLTVRVPADAGVAADQRVLLRVERGAVHLFGESGDRIPTGPEV